MGLWIQQYGEEGTRGFLSEYADYPRERVVEYLRAHDEARLTPTLAEMYPELAREYKVADWVCPECGNEFVWNDDRFDDASGTPDCPSCAQEGLLSELKVAG